MLIIVCDGVVLGIFVVYYGEMYDFLLVELVSIDSLIVLVVIVIEYDQVFQQFSMSEQCFCLLFDYYLDVVFVFDGEGCVLQVNGLVLVLFGEMESELQQWLLLCFFDVDCVCVGVVLVVVVVGDVEWLDVIVCDGCGGYFLGVLIMLLIIVYGQFCGMFVVLQDYCELCCVQQVMVSQLGLFVVIVDSVGEGLLVVDVDGVFIFFNCIGVCFLELLVYGLLQVEVLLQVGCEVLCGILGGSGYVSSDDVCFELGEGCVFDVVYVVMLLCIEGVLVGVVLVFCDIGDFKEVCCLLCECQWFFELLLEVFCIYDGENGYFVQVNLVFCWLFGYDEVILCVILLVELVYL